MSDGFGPALLVFGVLVGALTVAAWLICGPIALVFYHPAWVLAFGSFFALLLAARWARAPDFRTLGFLALEAGWLVTEWGRQPFTIWGVMRTADAVTPVTHLAVPFTIFIALYLFLAATTGLLLWRQILRAPPPPAGGAP